MSTTPALQPDPEPQAVPEPEPEPSPEPRADGVPALRDPANRPSTRAPWYWMVHSGISWVAVGLGVGFASTWVDTRHWWVTLTWVALGGFAVVDVLIAPWVKARVHRWEVTADLVYTQSGWLSRERRIVPLSRVQTVDAQRGPLQRVFGLASVTVTTASAAGPVEIPALDSGLADRLAAELSARTAADPGDAT